MDKIPLSKLINLVTSELRKAEKEAQANEKHIMQFEECELEMAIEVETSGKGEVGVWVFKLGGGRTKTDSNTIKVKFKRLQDVQLVYPSTITSNQGPPLGTSEEGKD